MALTIEEMATELRRARTERVAARDAKDAALALFKVARDDYEDALRREEFWQDATSHQAEAEKLPAPKVDEEPIPDRPDEIPTEFPDQTRTR